MVKEVRKEDSEKFVQKAEEFYRSGLENYQKSRFNVSSFDSSQAIILANDALCIFVLGRRASKDHREAIGMHVEACLGKENKKEIVAEAVEKRSKFGYTQVDSKKQDSYILLVRSKRFIDWVKDIIK